MRFLYYRYLLGNCALDVCVCVDGCRVIHSMVIAIVMIIFDIYKQFKINSIEMHIYIVQQQQQQQLKLKHLVCNRLALQIKL